MQRTIEPDLFGPRAAKQIEASTPSQNEAVNPIPRPIREGSPKRLHFVFDLEAEEIGSQIPIVRDARRHPLA